LKSVAMSEIVATEAFNDAKIDRSRIDPYRFATSISTQFGDIGYLYQDLTERDQWPPPADRPRWWNEFMPCSASSIIANKLGLYGPRLCHATACASGLVSTIAAARMIQDGQADFALCGAADMVHELMLASFHRMGVLANTEDPEQACRPFDVDRSGFVMGEGAAMMVLERRSQAIARGAKIYAELASSSTLCLAAHVTGLDGAADSLAHLIRQLVRKAGWEYRGPDYINAHGTGTEQNDISELQGIREGLDHLADHVLVSSNKAVIGHLINAAGSVELAITAMALRDGFAPPTMNLQRQEAKGQIDCLPRYGEKQELDRALKLSLAFGGHLVGIGLQRCEMTEHRRPSQPLAMGARVRQARTVSKSLVERAA
jgi:3-oxoacyl-(acyl-carrier-protein) synthase